MCINHFCILIMARKDCLLVKVLSMSANRHYCVECGSKRYHFYMYQIWVSHLKIKFWLCEDCFWKQEPYLSVIKKPR